MLHNHYRSHNLIGHYHTWVVSPRNSTLFTRLFFAGRHTWAGHETRRRLRMRLAYIHTQMSNLQGFRCTCANSEAKPHVSCIISYLWCHDPRHGCRLELGVNVGRGMVITTQESLTSSPNKITANSHCRIAVAAHMGF